MKKYIFKGIALLGFAVLLTACSKDFGDGVKLKGIEVGENLSLNMGTKTVVPAYPIPYDCRDYKFSFSSSNTEVAEVDSYGNLVANDVGDATITITSGNYTNTVNVNVYEITIGERCQDIDGLVGLWEFPNDAPMRATVGKDMVAYAHWINTIGTPVEFGTSPYGDAFSPHIVAGFNKRDGAIECGQYATLFYCEHGLTSPDTYTLLFDCLRPAKSNNAYTTFVGGTALDNTEDQLIYLRKEGYTQFGSGSNRSTNAISNDTWYRFVFVKKGSEYMRTYVNGVKWNEGADPTAAVLNPVAMLVNGDNDTDNTWLQFSTVAVFDKALSEEEILSLGGL